MCEHSFGLFFRAFKTFGCRGQRSKKTQTVKLKRSKDTQNQDTWPSDTSDTTCPLPRGQGYPSHFGRSVAGQGAARPYDPTHLKDLLPAGVGDSERRCCLTGSGSVSGSCALGFPPKLTALFLSPEKKQLWWVSFNC